MLHIVNMNRGEGGFLSKMVYNPIHVEPLVLLTQYDR
jgi:hypothetical protein